MSFPTEALVIGAREALKAVLLWLVLASVLQGRRSLGLYWMGLALGLAAGAWGALVGLPEGATWWLRRLGGYVFFLCFFFALGAFLQGAGYNLAGPLRGLGRPLLPLLVLVLLLSFLPPDFAQAGGFLAELALMREDALGVWGLALAGFSATAVAGFLLARRLRGGLGAFLGLGEVLLSLALIKLLLGGTRGFAELSLIPAVRQGVMKFIHDAVHQLFVFFMVPDHPLLQTTVWTFIGVLFSPQVAVYGVLALLMLPPLWQLRMALFAPLPEPPEPLRAARRRAFKARVRAQRLRRAVPVAVFVVAVLASWVRAAARPIHCTTRLSMWCSRIAARRSRWCSVTCASATTAPRACSKTWRRPAW